MVPRQDHRHIGTHTGSRVSHLRAQVILGRYHLVVCERVLAAKHAVHAVPVQPVLHVYLIQANCLVVPRGLLTPPNPVCEGAVPGVCLHWEQRPCDLQQEQALSDISFLRVLKGNLRALHLGATITQRAIPYVFVCNGSSAGLLYKDTSPSVHSFLRVMTGEGPSRLKPMASPSGPSGRQMTFGPVQGCLCSSRHNAYENDLKVIVGQRVLSG